MPNFYNFSSKGKILIKSSSYNSIRQLSGVIIHELSHMSDFVSNIYGIWATKYNSLEMARAHSEVKAYGMQACYGDSYFSTLNEDYLKWVNIFNSRN